MTRQGRGCSVPVRLNPGKSMQTVLIVIHLFVVLAMVGFVLLQKSEGGGLGIGSTGGFLSSRGTSNVLSRTTAILAITFFVTSMGLSILAGMDRKPTSVIKGGTSQQTPGAPAAPAGGLLDTLRQNEPAPSGPQVPRSQ
jgi:preprotein translocase subunit SecG